MHKTLLCFKLDVLCCGRDILKGPFRNERANKTKTLGRVADYNMGLAEAMNFLQYVRKNLDMKTIGLSLSFY